MSRLCLKHCSIHECRAQYELWRTESRDPYSSSLQPCFVVASYREMELSEHLLIRLAHLLGVQLTTKQVCRDSRVKSLGSKFPQYTFISYEFKWWASFFHFSTGQSGLLWLILILPWYSPELLIFVLILVARQKLGIIIFLSFPH